MPVGKDLSAFYRLIIQNNLTPAWLQHCAVFFNSLWAREAPRNPGGRKQTPAGSQFCLQLRREGVVEEAGRARGTRRPAVIYSLRTGAEVRLFRAYPLALARLVQAAAKKLRGPAFVELPRATGRRLALAFAPASGEAGQRVAAARSALEELGSRVEVLKQDGKYILRGDSCPLGETVILENKTCVALAAMLQEISGLSVQECCEHGERPRCRFQIEVPRR